MAVARSSGRLAGAVVALPGARSLSQRLQLRLKVENDGDELITAQVFKLGTVHATRIPHRCKTAREGRE
jgi:hypothetical protein